MCSARGGPKGAVNFYVEVDNLPQIRLEYSGNVTEEILSDKLFLGIHEVLRDTGGIRIGNCKSRSFRCDPFRIGAGEPENAFVHLEVRILEGRSSELKGEIGRALLDVLAGYFAGSAERLDLQITVEICDIKRDAYFKYPAGTLTPQKG